MQLLYFIWNKLVVISLENKSQPKHVKVLVLIWNNVVVRSIFQVAVNLLSKYVGHDFLTANFPYNEKMCILLFLSADDS